MGASGSGSSSRSSSGSGSYLGHTHVETDGQLGFKVEHHKNGNGDYVWQWASKGNDGMVREKMGSGTLREKDDKDGRANDRVSKSYQESSGSYNVVTDNCQHASNKAYDAADNDDSCSLM